MPPTSNVRGGGVSKRKRSASPIVHNSRHNKKKKVNSDDWHEGSFVEKLDHLLETGLCSDCSFKVGPEDGDTQVFRAHKMMLALASPVFYAMFFGAMPETKEEIRIIDMEPQTFKHMLKFIYTNNEMQICDLNDYIYEELEGLILAADKYLITALKVAAIKEIANHLCFCKSNMWRCFELAETINDSQLREICSQAFDHDASNNLEDPQFLSLSRFNLVVICKHKQLELSSELPVINACINWAKNMCKQRNLEVSGANIRECLGPQVIAHLRFLSLSPQEFVGGPGAQDWLTKDEKFLLIKGIVSKKKHEKLDGFCDITISRGLVQVNDTPR